MWRVHIIDQYKLSKSLVTAVGTEVVVGYIGTSNVYNIVIYVENPPKRCRNLIGNNKLIMRIGI